MEEVTQRFTADMAEYVSDVERGADDARQFARANDEAAQSLQKVRDDAMQAAAALGWYEDAQGRMRDASGRFVSVARQEEAGLRGIRDSAEQAAKAQDDMGRKSRSLSADLDNVKSRLSGLGGTAASISGLGDVMNMAASGGSKFKMALAAIPVAARPLRLRRAVQGRAAVAADRAGARGDRRLVRRRRRRGDRRRRVTAGLGPR
jgi:hypothetical protein